MCHTYLGVVVMVQPRQQLDHDAQGPGVHDHGITFFRPADRGEAHQPEPSGTSVSHRPFWIFLREATTHTLSLPLMST